MYNCQFPDCKYQTENRSQIVDHHIIPRELGGSNKKNNLIFLCPNHHTKIYIPEATNGIHAIKGDDSIILKGWLNSTGGKVLEYTNGEDEICLY